MGELRILVEVNKKIFQVGIVISRDISTQVSGGKPLSDALQSFPRSFPPVYCAMVHAGESSGRTMPTVTTPASAVITARMTTVI